MITPKFVIVLLLLGHTLAGPITFQFDVAPSKPFTTTFDPGFKVVANEVKINNNKIDPCTPPSKAANAAKDCYTQSDTVLVNFMLKDLTDATKVEFKDNSNSIKEFTLVDGGQTLGDNIAMTSNKIAEENFPLSKEPTQIIAMNGQGAMVQSADAGPGCKKDSSVNCLSVVDTLYPVTVTVIMETTPKVLTLGKQANQVDLKVIFNPVSDTDTSTTSTATWMSLSVGLIPANLAIVYLAH